MFAFSEPSWFFIVCFTVCILKANMNNLERIIEQLREQVKESPLLRSAVELVVAIGEEILQSEQHGESDSATPEVRSSKSIAGKEHRETSNATRAAELLGLTRKELYTSAKEKPITQESLARLIAHFRGEAYDPKNSSTSSTATPPGESLWHKDADDRQHQGEPVYDVDLVTSRARLKAEVARWCADRLRGAISPESESRYYDNVIMRAKAYPQCYLWMLDYDGTPALLEYVADCYEAIAEVAELLPLIPKQRQRPEWAESLLSLAAAAQSALHQILPVAGVDVIQNPDPDQDAVFTWLKWYTKTFQKFIPRHMTLRDPADYTKARDIIEQIDKLRQELPSLETALTKLPSEENAESAQPAMLPLSLEAKRHLRALRYHVGHIVRQSIDPEHHWQRIREEIEALSAVGVPPSNVELRAALLPVVDNFPTDDDFSTPPVRLVLREIHRYLQQQRAAATPAESEQKALSSAVKKVEGKEVVLIGGDERLYNKQAIEEAFGCQLTWVPTRPHESLDLFVPYVARHGVALVMLAIRWSSHSYAGIADLCKQYGKPFVRLPGGYNPNQIAVQILSQVGNIMLPGDAPAAGLEPATL